MTQQAYEQKKYECWEEFCQHIVDEEEAFYNMFDKAYALGKEKESITQEEIEKAIDEYVRNNPFAHPYSAIATRESYRDGIYFALGKKEKDTADTVISGWVAVDDDGDLFLYRTKPARDEVSGMWLSHECPLDVGINLFSDLTWDSDPEPVEIIIKRKKK